MFLQLPMLLCPLLPRLRHLIGKLFVTLAQVLFACAVVGALGIHEVRLKRTVIRTRFDASCLSGINSKRILTALNVNATRLMVLDHFGAVLGGDWITTGKVQPDARMTGLQGATGTIDTVKWLPLVPNVFRTRLRPAVAP